MTEPEDFLTRWSRRKRASGAEPTDRPAHAQTVPDKAPDVAQALPHQAGDAISDDAFDLSKLPSLDSIGPQTDIRIFMQPGVPAALSRAALRRAWSADPAIRDFIGLSENSWDFTASDGMHGFGALDPADAKRLIARLLGGHDDPDGPVAATSSGMPDGTREGELAQGDDSEANPDGNNEASAPRNEAPVSVASATPEPATTASADAAPQDDVALRDRRPPLDTAPPRRAHGRALPR